MKYYFTINSGSITDILEVGAFCYREGLSCEHEEICKYDDRKTKTGKGHYTFSIYTDDDTDLVCVREYVDNFNKGVAA